MRINIQKHLILDFKEIHLNWHSVREVQSYNAGRHQREGFRNSHSLPCGQSFHRDLDGTGSPFERLVKALREVSSEYFPSRVTAHIVGARVRVMCS